jgi:hypothetical protein
MACSLMCKPRDTWKLQGVLGEIKWLSRSLTTTKWLADSDGFPLSVPVDPTVEGGLKVSAEERMLVIPLTAVASSWMRQAVNNLLQQDRGDAEPRLSQLTDFPSQLIQFYQDETTETRAIHLLLDTDRSGVSKDASAPAGDVCRQAESSARAGARPLATAQPGPAPATLPPAATPRSPSAGGVLTRALGGSVQYLTEQELHCFCRDNQGLRTLANKTVDTAAVHKFGYDAIKVIDETLRAMYLKNAAPGGRKCHGMGQYLRNSNALKTCLPSDLANKLLALGALRNIVSHENGVLMDRNKVLEVTNLEHRLLGVLADGKLPELFASEQLDRIPATRVADVQLLETFLTDLVHRTSPGGGKSMDGNRDAAVAEGALWTIGKGLRACPADAKVQRP